MDIKELNIIENTERFLPHIELITSLKKEGMVQGIEITEVSMRAPIGVSVLPAYLVGVKINWKEPVRFEEINIA